MDTSLDCNRWDKLAYAIVIDINNGFSLKELKSHRLSSSSQDAIMLSIVNLAYHAYESYRGDPDVFANTVYNLCLDDKLTSNYET